MRKMTSIRVVATLMAGNANSSRNSAGAMRQMSNSSRRHQSRRILPLARPPDPSTLPVANCASKLYDWFKGKSSVLVITGAGLSTESGIPDYRGSNGSYHRGHKPIIHHEFMQSELKRKRYWGRSMAGHSPFVRAKPNQGHKALFELEELGLIGVRLNSCSSFDDLTPSCGDGLKDDTISIVTQNVDMLHAKAGTRHCLHLHGRGDLVSCQSCGFSMERTMYHHQLIASNRDWYEKARYVTMDASKLRPDGDADLDGQVVYDELFLPACPRCSNYKSFFKTSVVFFGDQVPKHVSFESLLGSSVYYLGADVTK
mmetsp:Transcript_29602/g.67631  ORF Transcript_29602/g.67631 Transcript_29602/m.67631 type:complete len:313 (-) Transcript_29602:340-1278(-)